jgi:hypothetical protein
MGRIIVQGTSFGNSGPREEHYEYADVHAISFLFNPLDPLIHASVAKKSAMFNMSGRWESMPADRLTYWTLVDYINP